MSRKRRIFDIDMPDEAPQQAPAPDADTPASRRGPMASAISENAEALKARAGAEAAIRAENDALAHELVAMRAAGMVVERIPLDQIHTFLLTRERMASVDEGLPDLVTSIREVGLSNPIRVEPRADGQGFELVQGYRRLSAYRALSDSDGEAYAAIPALVFPRGADVSDLYRRMVDENVVRKDLSFAEMANAAMNFAADPQTPEMDVNGAIKVLFASAPYSKQSYIRSFVRLLEALGDTLRHANEIPRKLGIELARRIDDRPEVAGQIRDALRDWDNRAISDELDVLRRAVGSDELSEEIEAPAAKPKRPRGAGGQSKTTFDLRTSQGRVKCTAASGRLEIKADRDFSTMDRDRLERAIAALIDGLG